VKISEDLGHCDVILGVKEIPGDKIVPGKMHFCFSHTHKGQPSGISTLAAFKEKGATLVDYELLTEEGGKRILAFGKYAGCAGMIDCLHGLGDRILQLGYRTPFLV
jgi:alpha-aminoadipic semialdehyde synthase